MRIGATYGNGRPQREKTIPSFDGPREGAMSDKLREKSQEEAMEPRRQVGFELAETVPEFDASEIANGPIFPGNIGLMEFRSGRIYGVCKECQPAAAPDGLQERSRVLGELRELAAGAEHKEVIFLWIAATIMDLLAGEHEDPACGRLNVAINSLNPNIVVRYEHNIQAGFDRSFSNLTMAPRAVGIRGVHVQIQDDFVHRGTLDVLG
jgi:hypothetical protein